MVAKEFRKVKREKKENMNIIVMSIDDIRLIIDVGFWNAQIPLMLNLRKDRRTNFLLLLKLGIKVCRIIIERYKYLILYKRR
jgi:hypothetical protein